MRVIFPETQVNIILTALDFYVRVLIGQYDVFAASQRVLFSCGNAQDGKRDVREILMDLRDQIIPELHSLGFMGNYGIYNRDRDIRAGEAYNIYQEFRYKSAHFYHPEGGFSTSFDKPLWTGDDPYPHPSVFFTWSSDGTVIAEAQLCREQLQIIIDALEMYQNHIGHRYVKLFQYLSKEPDVMTLAGELEEVSGKTDIQDVVVQQDEKQSEKDGHTAEKLKKIIGKE